MSVIDDQRIFVKTQFGFRGRIYADVCRANKQTESKFVEIKRSANCVNKRNCRQHFFPPQKAIEVNWLTHNLQNPEIDNPADGQGLDEANLFRISLSWLTSYPAVDVVLFLWAFFNCSHCNILCLSERRKRKPQKIKIITNAAFWWFNFTIPLLFMSTL